MDSPDDHLKLTAKARTDRPAFDVWEIRRLVQSTPHFVKLPHESTQRRLASRHEVNNQCGVIHVLVKSSPRHHCERRLLLEMANQSLYQRPPPGTFRRLSEILQVDQQPAVILPSKIGPALTLLVLPICDNLNTERRPQTLRGKGQNQRKTPATSRRNVSDLRFENDPSSPPRATRRCD
jgi:hypothetical protein